MHLVYPPKLCITIDFDFSWHDCNSLENLETIVMQNSQGENKVHYGLCETSDYKRWKACIKLSYLTDNLVPRSPRSCAGLSKWRLRDGPTRHALMRSTETHWQDTISEAQGILTKITSSWHLDKLAKPPLFVAYCRLCRHCRNLAEGGCRLSRFHFSLCRYFVGHVACQNLPLQGRGPARGEGVPCRPSEF